MEEDKTLTFSGYLGPQFQMKLLWQIVTEPEFSEKIIPLLHVNYFDDAPTKLFFIVLKDYYNDNEKVPNLQNDSVYQAIKKYSDDDVNEEILKGVLEKIKLWNQKIINDPKLFDGDIVQKEAYTYIRQQEYRKLADFIISKVKVGSTRESDEILGDIDIKVKRISEIGEDENFGSELFDDIDSALAKEFRKPIPTGIKGIDDVTGGGLGRGEIGILLAASGVGKTTFLSRIAHKAQEVEKNVLQIVFEDTVDQIKRKHYSIISDIMLSEIDNNNELVKERVLAYKSDNVLGTHVIARFPQENTTIPKIRLWIDRYQKRFGIKFDMIVLDYIDCVEPHNKSVDITAGEIGIIKAFESMSAEYDIPCWTAIQTNRSGFNAELVDASQMGGSIKRAQKTHFLMSVAKTAEQKISGRANISILKARFAQDGHIFKDCVFDNDTMEITITDDVKTYTKGVKTKNITNKDVDDFSDIVDKKEEELFWVFR
jgi:nucleoside-triphosphatase THEP1